MKDLLLMHVNVWDAKVTLNNFLPDEFGFDRVHVTHLSALVKGGGARALDMICKNADDLGVVLSLNACPLQSEVYHTQWSADRLVEWYGRRGFKRVNSRDPLFDFMGRLMVRTATKPVLAPPWRV